MTLNDEVIEKIKNDIVSFAITETEKFLTDKCSEVFYAFAFDLNAAYGEINLCLNTEEYFQKTLNYYQNKSGGNNYHSQDEINSLKYNTGDWEYQCFGTIYPINETYLEQLYQKSYEDGSYPHVLTRIIQIFSECLTLFKQTETYKKIPKTEDFIAFTIDHDEDVEDALMRIGKY
ncbi:MULTISPECIES: DUF4303 domain-containing protein [Enterobacterales]|uniref:DUF4303 domain-containing protein n=1 Tax=Enterobacterales TaxID=91347 RepID=UPI00084828D0|nr:MULTISPECIES: DUF4303 domain-containing protein [Enterobacterales]ODQ05927.1 hypothetical protein BGK50_18515 [Shigella sp. FC130]OEI93846.1 hypothetical protein BHE86_17405 [Shigella sp. FC1655]WOO51144.1 DUF4303 domain-containing protein [Hafnia alvei]WPF05615.1 DUF4303 domain-containing protein [Proteus vulgaris]